MLPLDMDCLMAYYSGRVFNTNIAGRGSIYDTIALEIKKLN